MVIPPATAPRSGSRPPAARPRGLLRDEKDRPAYAHDSHPPGYKIWVGDLPDNFKMEDARRRIWDTLYHSRQAARWNDILAIVVKQSRADSRASYAVITVGELGRVMVTQLT